MPHLRGCRKNAPSGGSSRHEPISGIGPDMRAVQGAGQDRPGRAPQGVAGPDAASRQLPLDLRDRADQLAERQSLRTGTRLSATIAAWTSSGSSFVSSRTTSRVLLRSRACLQRSLRCCSASSGQGLASARPSPRRYHSPARSTNGPYRSYSSAPGSARWRAHPDERAKPAWARCWHRDASGGCHDDRYTRSRP
jgi:hypothetical protein